MSARRGRLKVRTGKGDAYREVPLNSASRKALDEWFDARTDLLTALATLTAARPRSRPYGCPAPGGA
jgi:site-specific recombinase XerC